jgi:hypothetical protein
MLSYCFHPCYFIAIGYRRVIVSRDETTGTDIHFQQSAGIYNPADKTENHKQCALPSGWRHGRVIQARSNEDN